MYLYLHSWDVCLHKFIYDVHVLSWIKSHSTQVCVCIYIYIYIYIKRERGKNIYGNVKYVHKCSGGGGGACGK